MIRVDTGVDGRVYSAELEDDDQVVIRCGIEELGRGRWSGSHIVGMSGAALLPDRVVATFEAVFCVEIGSGSASKALIVPELFSLWEGRDEDAERQ